jgi:methionyl-tRNA formyltransferase
MTEVAEPTRYVVAGAKPWNRKVFDEVIRHYPGTWTYVDDASQLGDVVRAAHPRYAFFLHWSWKVPPDILAATECVNFHMTDVPYGRGGSPLQNLIVRGHHATKLTALGMVDELDAGPVYAKLDLDLHGSAEEVYVRATRTAAEMIGEIVAKEIEPKPQAGEVVAFGRRRPAESEVPDLSSVEDLHDFIRMLDADGYPRAFLEHKGFRYTFGRAVLYDGRIVADVTITRNEAAES